MKTEQLKLPVIVDSDGNPIGIIFYSVKNRQRVIYLVKEPSEEELISLLECQKEKV